MSREIGQIIRDESWTKENVAELRKALNEVTNFASDTVYRHLSSRTNVETLDSLRLLRESIERFDEASGKMVTRGNRINVGVLIFAVVAAVLGAGALWVSWLSYRLALAPIGK